MNRSENMTSPYLEQPRISLEEARDMLATRLTNHRDPQLLKRMIRGLEAEIIARHQQKARQILPVAS
jgi:hypothetical protein